MNKARELYNLVEATNPNTNSKLIRACIGNGDQFLNQIALNDKDKCLQNAINALIKVAQMKFEPDLKTLQNSTLDATSSFRQVNIEVIGNASKRAESVASKSQTRNQK